MYSKWFCYLLVISALMQAACCGGGKALEEDRGKKKKAILAHVAYFIATKVFVLKIVYAVIFFILLHKATYVISWVFHYLKEVKKEKVHHHEHDDHDHHHYDYGPPHVENGPPPSYYGSKYYGAQIYGPPQGYYGPPESSYAPPQSRQGQSKNYGPETGSTFGNEPYKRTVYDADGSYSVKGK